METIQPLPKRIYDMAKQLKIRSIVLQFSGGSDEGNLYIDLLGSDDDIDWNQLRPLENAIESWAWGAYSYSGAGDGNDYGDNIEYNLEKGTATATEWYTERVDGQSENMTLELDDESEQ